MSVFDEVREHESLGRDFLVWLWFRSETLDGVFDLGDDGEVELWFEGKITLQTDGERSTQTITCTGESARIREARFALREAKKVTRARLHLKEGRDEWSFELDSTWLNFHSLKTPKTFREKGEDPEALFYERIFLVEKPVAIMSALFLRYLEARLSPTWEAEEFPSLIKWVREGVSP
jgi:hypothetical protein